MLAVSFLLLTLQFASAVAAITLYQVPLLNRITTDATGSILFQSLFTVGVMVANGLLLFKIGNFKPSDVGPFSYAIAVACFAGRRWVPPTSKPGSVRHRVRVQR